MKIHVKQIECAGHGQCAALAPEVYELDDDGFCAVEDLDVPAEHEDAAALGAASCPAQAIEVIEA
ncbi:ferredoxin [uncultured Modestobacter sp.]|uniref:ferredoxin n=1 Tax=uncultured Modestobacter sp. TaxID=380048 RepID=UPI00261B0841|nr:ferredoxin [uncultured Modestobacter sp.]